MRVSYIGITSAFQGDERGSTPLTRSNEKKIVTCLKYMVMPNTKLKVGVIGLGHQSIEDHIPAIKSSQDVKLVGIVESDKKKLIIF